MYEPLTSIGSNSIIQLFYDRTLSHKINHIHERALRFAYKDNQTDFESHLEQRDLLFIHVKNLQLLTTEIHKTRSGLSPPFMKDIFAERNTGYNLRHGNDSQLPKVHTTTYGIETISFLGYIGFGQLYLIYSNKPAHFLFSKTILHVGRARAATVDFAKYIYHRLGT